MKAGQHIAYPSGTPMTNLLLTVLDKVGVNVDVDRRQHGPALARLPLGRLDAEGHCAMQHRTGRPWLRLAAAAGLGAGA